MNSEKKIALFIVILNRNTNLKVLRIKMEDAALRCRKEMADMKVLIIKDELEDYTSVNEFALEKLMRWIGWVYRIKVDVNFISSPVPLLAAAREVRKFKYSMVFCVFGKNKIVSLLPKPLRAELSSLVDDCASKFIEV